MNKDLCLAMAAVVLAFGGAAFGADEDWSPWRVNCDHQDPARRRTCAAYALGPNEQFVAVGMEKERGGAWAPPTIAVYHRWGDREYLPALRVDQAKPLYLDAADAEATKQALVRMMDGKRLQVVNYRMPNRQRYEYTVPLEGFAASVALLLEVAKEEAAER